MTSSVAIFTTNETFFLTQVQLTSERTIIANFLQFFCLSILKFFLFIIFRKEKNSTYGNIKILKYFMSASKPTLSGLYVCIR